MGLGGEQLAQLLDRDQGSCGTQDQQLAAELACRISEGKSQEPFPSDIRRASSLILVPWAQPSPIRVIREIRVKRFPSSDRGVVLDPRHRRALKTPFKAVQCMLTTDLGQQ